MSLDLAPARGEYYRAEGTSVDRQPACGFCDGTGLWAAPEDDPGPADPCPLCEGSGLAPVAAHGPRDEAHESGSLPRLLAVLGRLSQAERQLLYEELHARYDCRIYR